MARFARIVAPGAPHHVVQRGGRRGPVFAGSGDYALYLNFLAEQCAWARVRVVAYALLPDRVHLILVPRDMEGLRRALATAHKRYARRINAKKGRTGKLWHGRFASYPLDEAATLACARYVDLLPVREGVAKSARGWCWSSAAAHMGARSQGPVKPERLMPAAAWRAYLTEGCPRAEVRAIEGCARTGRPLGSARFIATLEKRLGRVIAKQKPGPKPTKLRRKSP
jgi:putative transposase